MTFKSGKLIIFLALLSIVAVVFWIELLPVAETDYHKEITLIAVSSLALFAMILSIRMISVRDKKLFLQSRDMEKITLGAEDSRREAEILHILSSVSRLFVEKQDLTLVLNTVADTILKILQTDVSVIELFTNKPGTPRVKITKGIDALDLDQTIYDEVINRRKSVLISDLSIYGRYVKLRETGLHSMLVAPLSLKENVIGLIGVFSRERSGFAGNELELLTTFATQATLIIQNAMFVEINKELSITDELTQLFNFRYFKKCITDEFYRADRYNHPLSFLIADIDFFKHYNDTNGHQAGNVVLNKIAQIIKSNTRPSDINARYGGEEFAVILLETSKQGAGIVAEKIRSQIESTQFEFGEKQPNGKLTITIGVAAFPEDANSVEELIEYADKSLYKGKESGKNQVRFYNVD